MPKISLTLSKETAQRLKEYALKETGSLKKLSEVGEKALKEFLDREEQIR